MKLSPELKNEIKKELENVEEYQSMCASCSFTDEQEDAMIESLAIMADLSGANSSITGVICGIKCAVQKIACVAGCTGNPLCIATCFVAWKRCIDKC